MKKRKLDIVVLSDLHLGTYGCYADELLVYLSSIEPRILVLNGAIIDQWPLNTNSFLPSHLKVIQKINAMASKGIEVHYVKGIHDKAPTDLFIDYVKVCENLVLNVDGKKTGFFHGAILAHPFFNISWFRKFGRHAFGLLYYSNKLNHWISRKSIIPKSVLSKTVHYKKKNTDFTERFKSTVSDIGNANRYDTVVCGYLHQPEKTIIERPNGNGNILYLNAGDWVSHLSALEYSLKRWKIYRYENDKLVPFFMDAELKEMDMNTLIKRITSKKEKTEKATH
ncbi:hypothetical protein BFP77_15875 [Maribacter sp. 4U21]|uniref:UDP-2,3-diacylglucosamine diphosphatase n=1 Tax=Maribacter sp. 4U21 TaxID=1889779 RepID=UPI000C15B063|nr:UDP-2,3-diacylglucosamine diphosphatase [Maribacter sp. 4U21]PIB23785.1 hypothetical protein BFP77_15875 [Maribacter sp. 4U21]